METIILEVKAKHFKDTSFMSIYNCAICKAAREQFNANAASEGQDNLDVDNKHYKHNDYGENQFDEDKKLSAKHSFDETLIRTIVLTPQ